MFSSLHGTHLKENIHIHYSNTAIPFWKNDQFLSLDIDNELLGDTVASIGDELGESFWIEGGRMSDEG